jgi:hypothetical protein
MLRILADWDLTCQYRSYLTYKLLYIYSDPIYSLTW